MLQTPLILKKEEKEYWAWPVILEASSWLSPPQEADVGEQIIRTLYESAESSPEAVKLTGVGGDVQLALVGVRDKVCANAIPGLIRKMKEVINNTVK